MAVVNKHGRFYLSFGREFPDAAVHVDADTPEELLAAAKDPAINPNGYALVYIHCLNDSANGTGIWDNLTGWDDLAKRQAFPDAP